MADFCAAEGDLALILKRGTRYLLSASLPYRDKGTALAFGKSADGESYLIAWWPTRLKILIGKPEAWRYLFPENDKDESDCETMTEALDYVDALVEAARQERLA